MTPDEIRNLAGQIASVARNGAENIGRLGPDASEADTQDHFIAPVLHALGYPNSNMRREVADRRNVPDRIVWGRGFMDAEANADPALLLIEEKALGTDLRRPPGGAAATTSPSRQIQRYLCLHRTASNDTLGILTDGRHWHVYRRFTAPGGAGGIETWEAEHFDLLDPNERAIEDFVNKLAFDAATGRRVVEGRRQRTAFAGARSFLAKVSEALRANDPAARILHALSPDSVPAPVPEKELLGADADAARHDWNLPSARIADGPRLVGRLPGTAHVRLAAVPFRFRGSDSVDLRKADVALCARGMERLADAADVPLVLCAWTVNPHNGEATMRLAVRWHRRAAMTPEFSPDLASTTVLAAIECVLKALAQQGGADPAGLAAAFDLRPLQTGFYERIEEWLEFHRGQGNEERRRDRSLVRHLVRTMFAWVLKEQGAIPDLLFDRSIRELIPEGDSFHGSVLQRLFHDILNVPMHEREEPANKILALDPLFEATRFVNGSVFAPHHDDHRLDLPDSAYWRGRRGENPGLFDILSEYQWTAAEHTSDAYDMSLDPELLGAMFERLAALVEQTPAERRQPLGTYYTPRDVVDAMVQDSVAAAVAPRLGIPNVEEDIRKLLSTGNDAVPDWPRETQRCAAEILASLRVHDPAVGSGAFLLAFLDALLAARRKLHRALQNEFSETEEVRRIVLEQLHGCDIQPMAAQIARLRLFLALEAAYRGAEDPPPLPNLEARVVCGDTLAAVHGEARRTEDLLGALGDQDPEFRDLLDSIQTNRRSWFNAHDDARKRELRREDDRLRNRFRDNLHGLVVMPQARAFAEWNPLGDPDCIAQTDPRLIFGCQGFDVVIGNPPYSDLERPRQENAPRPGQRAGRTEAAFLEIATDLARPDGGIIEFVVPLGVSFRRDHAELRADLQSRCSCIELRHYDMTPGKLFNTAPIAKKWPNKQRATLVTAVRGAGGKIRTTGLMRWLEEPRHNERSECLARRDTVACPRVAGPLIDVRISGQWPRIPSQPIGAMIDAIARSPLRIANLSSDGAYSLAIPKTGYLFIPALPPGAANPRNEDDVPFVSREDQKIAFALLNGHVFYAWWMMFGDGFHYVRHIANAMSVPRSWMDRGAIRDEVLTLAANLEERIPNCITEKMNAGTLWRNVDFFTGEPDLIERLDWLHIESLGLNPGLLLPDIRAVRSNSNWRIM